MWNNAGVDEVERWFIRTRCEAVTEALKKNRIQAFYAATKDDAKKKVLQMIPKDASVGVAGSVTIRQLGLIESLEKRGNQLFHHWKPGLTDEGGVQERKKENSADILLASSNAITTDGKLVNACATGNRVAGMLFGPKTVILVAGYNKIVEDIDAAIWRIKNIVTPMNAKRHGRDLPCARTTFCTDCRAEMRQDCVITIIEMRTWRTDLCVILVGERLGF